MTKLTKSEIDDLKAVGYIEGQPDTIPENISPVLKSRLLADMGEDATGHVPGIPGEPSVHPLDHDADGKKGGSLPKAKRVAKKA